MTSIGPYGSKCLQFTNGELKGYLYIPERDSVTVEQLIDSGITLYSIEQIKETPGVYTYIVTNDGEYRFAAFPSPSTLELFSKHVVLSSLSGTDDSSILYAGEMKSSGDGKVQYNFLSGSYMQAKMEMDEGLEPQEIFDKYNKPLESIIYDTMAFDGMLEYDDSFETFITSKNVSLQEIELLKRMKIPAYLVETKRECMNLYAIKRKEQGVKMQLVMAANTLNRFSQEFASTFESEEHMKQYIYDFIYENNTVVPEYNNTAIVDLIRQYKQLLLKRDEICIPENDITRLPFHGGKRIKKKRTRTRSIQKRNTKRRKRASKK